MATMTITCPVCGSQVQTEAGGSTLCPNCGYALNTPAAGANAFAQQGMQFAQDVQFAPPPVQMMQQPMQMQQPAAMPMPQAQQFMPQQPMPTQYLYSPAQLQEAQKKQKSWHMLNAGMIAVQTLIMAVGIALAAADNNKGVAMILSWVLSLPLCGFLSGYFRPDEAYIDRKPKFKSKVAQAFIQFILGSAISSATGGILAAILMALFNIS